MPFHLPNCDVVCLTAHPMSAMLRTQRWKGFQRETRSKGSRAWQCGPPIRPASFRVAGGTDESPPSVRRSSPSAREGRGGDNGGHRLGRGRDRLRAGFQKQYPNVTITGTWDPDDVTTQNQPRQLASATPPDLVRLISVTDAVKNNLVTNLDPYAKAYGWDQLPASQLVQFEVSADGVAGSGPLYAKPSGFTMTGLYYNKALAQQIGMTQPPASVDDLTTLLGKAKSAGLQPIMTGNQQGGAVLSYQLMLNTSMGVKPTSDWVFNVAGSTIDNPDSVKAATVLDQWN